MGELLIEELLKEDSLCGLLNPSVIFGHSLSHVPISASLKEGGGSNVRYVSAAALLPLRYRYFASVSVERLLQRRALKEKTNIR